MTRNLATVQRAARRRTEADRAYLAALLQARQDGNTLAAIGNAAGVSKQAVAQLLNRHTTPKEG